MVEAGEVIWGEVPEGAGFVVEVQGCGVDEGAGAPDGVDEGAVEGVPEGSVVVDEEVPVKLFPVRICKRKLSNSMRNLKMKLRKPLREWCVPSPPCFLEVDWLLHGAGEVPTVVLGCGETEVLALEEGLALTEGIGQEPAQ